MFNFVQNAQKYGAFPNTWDVLKAIALLLMIADHMGHYFFPMDFWWRAFGRLCVPMWLFLAGYAKPSPEHRMTELYVLAVFLAGVDWLFGQPIFPLNILVSIAVARWFIRHVHRRDRDFLTLGMFALALVVLYPVSMALFEYGTLALLLALAGYYMRTSEEERGDALAKASLALSALLYILVQITTFGFNWPQVLLVSGGTMLVFALLSRFSVRPMATGIRWLDGVIVVAARNSLYLYALHLWLFVGLNWALNPHAPALFSLQWLR